MKDIVIVTSRPEYQRYPTAGDYWENHDVVNINITEQDNEDYEFLIAIHELVEFWITRKRDIKEEDITNYDLEWEKRNYPKADEPGNEIDCIYKDEHRFAENIERQIAHEIGVDWEQYNKDLKI